MSEPNTFFIDLLEILPRDLYCYMQAPSLDNIIIKKMLQDIGDPYKKMLHVDGNNRHTIIDEEIRTQFTWSVQNIEIRNNGILLFQGFDGIQHGGISYDFKVPEWFTKKYIPGDCWISHEW